MLNGYLIYDLLISYEDEQKQTIRIEEKQEFTQHMIDSCWKPYFQDIYTSLMERSDTIGVTKARLHEYVRLPGLIFNSFFRVMNSSKTRIVTLQEFTDCLSTLYFGKLEEKAELIFKMYDYNSCGRITKEDIRSLMSYIPLAKYIEAKSIIKEGSFTTAGESSISYYDKLAIQSDMIKLFSIHIPSHSIDCKEFLIIIQHSLSDIFLSIYLTLRKHLPTSEQIISNKTPRLENTTQPFISLSPPIHCASPIIGRLLTTSAINSHSPVIKSTKPTILTMNEYATSKNIQSSFLKHVLENAKKVGLAQNSSFNAVRKPNASFVLSPIETIDITLSPTMYLKNQVDQSQVSLSTCECGNICQLGEHKCSECKLYQSAVLDGYIYVKHEGNKLKRFLFKLKDRELSYEEVKGDPKSIKVIPLHAMSIEEDVPMEIDAYKLYPFLINDDIHVKRMYTTSKEERDKWVSMLRKALGIKCITDYYVISKDLANGKFGKVKLAMHIATNRRVAIKVVEKTAFDDKERELLFNEVEILKISQHPNIIKMLDLFENPTTTFMVMEYSPYGDLYNFMSKRNFMLTEEKATSIMIEVAKGIKFLHSYNIVHRDLKPENILLMNSDASDVKITDFGLSKIIHNSETLLEPFGTITYVSPELLLKKPYSKSVDIWGLGVIYYLMLGGTLPFDDEKPSMIMKRIVECEPNFTEGKWKTISAEAKQILKRMLCKQAIFRCNIDDILKEPYIVKMCTHISNSASSDKIALKK